jgi:hypothetical protein
MTKTLTFLADVEDPEDEDPDVEDPDAVVLEDDVVPQATSATDDTPTKSNELRVFFTFLLTYYS